MRRFSRRTNQLSEYVMLSEVELVWSVGPQGELVASVEDLEAMISPNLLESGGEGTSGR